MHKSALLGTIRPKNGKTGDSPNIVRAWSANNMSAIAKANPVT